MIKIHSKKLLVAQIVAANLAFAANVTFAEEKTIEEVVVTGFRGSLQQALNVKRDESGIVDAIMAEDIADFPDLNLAESIQRIPGISINRVNGEGRQVTARGLSGDFNRILINGMEAMSTTGASDASGGSNKGRGFDFNTFASELFNSIVVKKTYSADTEEGALGATIELRTARPFDYDEGVTVATSFQQEYNDVSEEWSPRFAGLASYTNEDKTFGALMSVAYSDRTIQEEGFSTVRWQDGTFLSVGGVSCADNPADQGCVDTDTNSLNYHPRIPRYGRLTHQQERLGITGALQFKPSDKTEITVEGLYSNFKADRDEEYLEVFLRSQEKYIDVNSYTLDTASNTMTAANFDIPQLANGTHPIRSEHRFDILETEFTQFTLDIAHQFTDQLRGHLFAGTSKSEFNNPVQTTILADAVGTVSGYSYDFSKNANLPAINFGSLDVTDPSQFAFTEFRDRPQSVNNEFKTFQADFAYDLDAQLTLSGGVSWKEFTFDSYEERRENTGGSLVCGYYDCDLDDDGVNDISGAPLTGALVGAVTGFGNGLGMPSGNNTSWVSPNVKAAAALLGIYDIPGSPQAGSINGVKEEDTGLWAQLDFEVEAGVPVRGNIGGRWVETKLTSRGLVNGDAVVVDNKYNDFLPALNLSFELQEDLILRAAAAKVITRPSLGNLTPGGSLDSFSGEPYTYSAGNPGLKPFRAKAYDLNLEYYFADEALVSVGYFLKDVSSFFTTSTSVEIPYSQTGLPTSLAPASSPLYNDFAAGLDPLVNFKSKESGDSAELDGFEVIYQQPFSFLPAPFNKMGFTGNFTKVSSDKIIGFSEQAYNATLYYEADKWSARVSAAYRDAYLTREANSAGRDERGVDSTMNIDFSATYQWSEEIDLTFEAINLTDEFESQIFDAADLNNVYHHTGRSFLFGVRWSPEI